MDDIVVSEKEFYDLGSSLTAFGACTDLIITWYNDILDSICADALLGGDTSERMLLFSAVVAKLKDKATDLSARTDQTLVGYANDINAVDRTIY